MKLNRYSLLILAGALAGCSGGQDESAVPTGDVTKELNNEIRGYDFRRGVIVGANETPHWVQLAVSGFQSADENQTVANIALLPAKQNCTFSPVRPDEHLAKVHVDSSENQISVYTFSKADIGKLAKEFVQEYRQTQGQAEPKVWRSSDALALVDVVVTETSKPVYLVLAHSQKTIFNIHLAPGASISRIALISQDVSAVVQLESAPPVEALSGIYAERCRIVPARKPADHWILVQRAKDGDQLNKEAVAQSIGFYSKYSKWFARSFGQPSEPDSIGAMQASHVLVGPLPQTLEARVPYKPLAGQNILVSKADYIFSSSEADYKAQKTKLIVDTAERALGAKLQTLIRQ